MHRLSFRSVLATLSLSMLALAASAHDFKVGEIQVGHPHARPTNAGQQVGAGYLKLDNRGPADRLVSVTTSAAKSVELHTMSMEGDMMKMRQLDAIELPKGATVELKPGGLHLMLMGLKAPLKSGDTFPMTLRFEKAGEVVVTVKVEVPQAGDAAPMHKH